MDTEVQPFANEAWQQHALMDKRLGDTQAMMQEAVGSPLSEEADAALSQSVPDVMGKVNRVVGDIKKAAFAAISKAETDAKRLESAAVAQISSLTKAEQDKVSTIENTAEEEVATERAKTVSASKAEEMSLASYATDLKKMVDLGTAEILKMQQITRKKNDKLLAQAVNEAVLKARKPFELEKKRILDERDSKIREIKSSSNEQIEKGSVMRRDILTRDAALEEEYAEQAIKATKMSYDDLQSLKESVSKSKEVLTAKSMVLSSSQGYALTESEMMHAEADADMAELKASTEQLSSDDVTPEVNAATSENREAALTSTSILATSAQDRENTLESEESEATQKANAAALRAQALKDEAATERTESENEVLKAKEVLKGAKEKQTAIDATLLTLQQEALVQSDARKAAEEVLASTKHIYLVDELNITNTEKTKQDAAEESEEFATEGDQLTKKLAEAEQLAKLAANGTATVKEQLETASKKEAEDKEADVQAAAHLFKTIELKTQYLAMRKQLEDAAMAVKAANVTVQKEKSSVDEAVEMEATIRNEETNLTATYAIAKNDSMATDAKIKAIINETDALAASLKQTQDILASPQHTLSKQEHVDIEARFIKAEKRFADAKANELFESELHADAAKSHDVAQQEAHSLAQKHEDVVASIAAVKNAQDLKKNETEAAEHALEQAEQDKEHKEQLLEDAKISTAVARAQQKAARDAVAQALEDEMSALKQANILTATEARRAVWAYDTAEVKQKSAVADLEQLKKSEGPANSEDIHIAQTKLENAILDVEKLKAAKEEAERHEKRANAALLAFGKRIGGK